MKQWWVLALAIAFEVSASLSLSAAQHAPAFFAVSTLGYGGAFACLSLVLRWGMPLAIAYGIWGAAGVALTALFGSVVFGDVLTAPMMLGILLIVCGVWLVEFGRPRERSGGAEPRRAGPQDEGGLA